MKTIKAMSKLNEWVCTDPDIKQYGRKKTETIFEFKDENTNPTLINLEDYNLKETEHIINAYGYTTFETNPSENLTNIADIYGAYAIWIIAECIFETEQY